jgi:hypothetical protein
MWKVKFERDELVYLVEEICKQESIHAAAEILLYTFSQIYSETWEQKEVDGKTWKLSAWPEKVKMCARVCLSTFFLRKLAWVKRSQLL